MYKIHIVRLKICAVNGKSRSHSDRNVIREVGPRPRVWRVYTRKKTKGMKDDDVAMNV